LAKYDSVTTEALQLSAEDVETGANVQLPASACLRVGERTLSPTFVLEQLMFWFHQPQRKNDVLRLRGAGELPCPTNVLRCCVGAGVTPEELEHHQELLAGMVPLSSARRSRLHVFAATLSEAFIGCAALCKSMKNLQCGVCYKQCVVPHRVDEGYSAPLGAHASAAGQPDASGQWYKAERIIAEKRVSLKRKRQMMYLVRWRGCQPSQDSWEPRANLNEELFTEWKCCSSHGQAAQSDGEGRGRSDAEEASRV
jgi:hypothetical protein